MKVPRIEKVGGGVSTILMLMLMSHGLGEQDWTAREWGAFMALLALRASAPVLYRGDVQSITINDTTAESDWQAVQVLSQLPKPVACSASVAESMLRITCETITDPVLVQAQRAKASRIVGTYPQRDPPPALALDAEGKRRIIPAAAIQVFLTDYRLNYALAFDDPDPEAERLGAVGTVQVRSFGNVQMFGSSPDVRWVFGERRDVDWE